MESPIHIVYELIFEERQKRGEYPFRYIGSKSNCRVIDGVIASKNKEYWGSSRSSLFTESLDQERPRVNVLSKHSSYKEALKHEQREHRLRDVIRNPEYFNAAVASVSTYSMPGYGTYKCVVSGKIVRLPVDDPKVINKEFVGVSLGMSNPYTGPSMTGENNPFYGKHHTEETKQKLSAMKKGTVLSEETKKLLSQRMTGRPLLWKHKIGRKGMIILYGPNGDAVRVHKKDAKQFTDHGYTTKKPKPDRQVECNVCGMVTSASNIKRWHNENCKPRKDPNERKTARRVIPVVIDGVEYPSIRQASEKTGIPRTKVKKLHESQINQKGRKETSL